MTKSVLHNKQVALLVTNVDDENDVHVYVGQVVCEETEQYFLNGSMGWKLSLDNEQISRLTPVTEKMKDIFLNADYFIPLSISIVPDKTNDSYLPTGLKW